MLGGATAGVFVTVLIWYIITAVIIAQGDLFAGILFITFILAAIVAALLVIYRGSLSNSISRHPPAKTGPVVSETETRQLADTHFEPVPSVVDSTTELLPRRKREQ